MSSKRNLVKNKKAVTHTIGLTTDIIHEITEPQGVAFTKSIKLVKQYEPSLNRVNNCLEDIDQFLNQVNKNLTIFHQATPYLEAINHELNRNEGNRKP